ncbi:hypothetical protein ACFVVC_03775 [Pseudarthrobacter sp. NPDC058196]|uniref:hypothetical protein n=1 Tax=Pseudarthrobacter sp. NPDC058196 TaxID=3346376 RepID=UPI0036D9769C
MKQIRKLRNWKHWPGVLSSAAIILGIVAVVIFVSGLLQGPTTAEPPNAAEWLSAISTFWGAVATAIGSLLTAGALLIAALSYRKQVADRHKAQAVSVTVGSRTEVTPAVSARRAVSGYFPTNEKHFYFVRNDSQLPIYRVELRVGESDDLKSSTREVLAPGDEESFEVSFAPFPAYARFTDSSGVTWTRDSSGKLTELYDETTVLTW